MLRSISLAWVLFSTNVLPQLLLLQYYYYYQCYYYYCYCRQSSFKLMRIFENKTQKLAHA